MTMKGKSSNPTYHVIQDVRRNGKRSTEIIENLGSASEICEKYHLAPDHDDRLGGDLSHIVVMQHVTTERLQVFLDELKAAL